MLSNLTIEKPYEHVLPLLQDMLPQHPVDGNCLYVREALLTDALLLDIREEQKDTFDASNPDLVYRQHAMLRILTPMNYTVFHGNDILLMATILLAGQGVAEISFLVDKRFVNSSRAVRFAMIKFFQEALQVIPFRRVQAKVKESFAVGRTFVEKLGMEQEGILKKFGPDGADYVMYGLIK